MKIVLLSLFLFLLIFFPILANAQIIITEVMYDVEGTDGGYEWIEVRNTYPDSVDLATYKVFENNVNHKITSESDSTLPSGSYAIVADNIVKFSELNSAYSGLLFDSAFSLNNTGETVSIYDSGGILEDTFTYTSEMGANGTGNSLQRNDGSIITAAPTMGKENAKTAVVETDDEGTDNSGDGGDNAGSTSGTSGSGGSSTHSSQTPLTKLELPPSLKIGAGREREVTVHSPIDFNLVTEVGKIRQVKWSFGDGGQGTGMQTKHIYKFPGEYVVVANASEREASAVSRTKVKVVLPDILVSLHNDKVQHVDIENNGESEINIGEYILVFEGKGQMLSKDTILLPKSKISIATVDMSFIEESASNGLFYPDGTYLSDIAPNIKDIELDQVAISQMCNELHDLGVLCSI